MALSQNKYSITYTNNTLYTKGGEFVVESTGEPYAGQYHLINGVAFTGKPKSEGIRRLIPSRYTNNDTYVYDKHFAFKSKPKYYVSPKFFRPDPTLSEYQVGYFYRYVVSHNLDMTKFPIEIGISQVNSYGARGGIDSGLWTLHRIKWVIVGNFDDIPTENPVTKQVGPTIPSVETQNRNTLEPIIRKYPMMQFAFRNYLEFAQPSN